MCRYSLLREHRRKQIMRSLTEQQQTPAKLVVLGLGQVEQEEEPGQVMHLPTPVKPVGRMHGLGRTQSTSYSLAPVERLLLTPENPVKQEPEGAKGTEQYAEAHVRGHHSRVAAAQAQMAYRSYTPTMRSLQGIDHGGHEIRPHPSGPAQGSRPYRRDRTRKNEKVGANRTRSREDAE